MNIVHVLSYISSDGAYGGPVAVAREQCEELASRGHRVKLLAGWDQDVMLELKGVELELHRAARPPRTGFGGLFAPGLWRSAMRAAADADIMHVHLARDFSSLPAALVAGRKAPLVIQTHGMIRVDNRVPTRVVDTILTRRVLRRTHAALALTNEEVQDLPRVARQPLAMVKIRNGVRIPDLSAEWAEEALPEVLYCARLHERKRPLDFVKMAKRLIDSGTHAKFTMIGPDEGQLQPTLEAIDVLGLKQHVRYEGALPPTGVLNRMSRAQIYVLPSVQEPFPMSALEAMSLGLPSVITTSTGISRELVRSGGAVVSQPGSSSLADATAELLSNRTLWSDTSARARANIEANFSTRAVVDRLEEHYRCVATKSCFDREGIKG